MYTLASLGVCVATISLPVQVTAQQFTSAVVIAELFTSEGCSSCPPADDLLTQLVSRPPIAGIKVLALGEHVDYWDRLGWRDPFSSAALTNRQAEYNARVFRENGIYTPQLVVDGQFQCIGSDARAVRQALAKAARLPKATVGVSAARDTSGDVRVDVQVDLPPEVMIREDADVLVAVTQDRLVTNVRRGENGGRTLRHTAVVRSLGIVGAVTPQNRTFATTSLVPVVSEWKIDDIRIVSFVQERNSRRILGGGTAGID
jgi:hypothetical protein